MIIHCIAKDLMVHRWVPYFLWWQHCHTYGGPMQGDTDAGHDPWPINGPTKFYNQACGLATLRMERSTNENIKAT